MLPSGGDPGAAFTAITQLDAVPEEDRGRHQTLSGMMMLLTGRLPKLADTAQWEGWRFEIVDMDGKTIDKVLASRVPEASEAVFMGGR